MRRTRQAAALRDACRLYEWVLRYLGARNNHTELTTGNVSWKATICTAETERAELYEIGFLYRGLQRIAKSGVRQLVYYNKRKSNRCDKSRRTYVNITLCDTGKQVRKCAHSGNIMIFNVKYVLISIHTNEELLPI